MKPRQIKSKSNLLNAIRTAPNVSIIAQHVETASKQELMEALGKASDLNVSWISQGRGDYYVPVIELLASEIGKRN